MQRFVARATVAIALLVTTACAQSAAPVDFKGQNNYTRGTDLGYQTVSHSASSYSSNSSSYTPPQGIYTNHPVSQETHGSVGVDSIGVSDLPPPPKSGKLGDRSENLAAKPINGWTGKPHDVAQETVVEKPQPKKLAQLDQVVISDKPVKAVAKEKSITVAHSAPSHFIWPVNGKKIISGFGSKGPGKANDGINIAAADGEPVWAAADGEVVYVGDQLSGYGNMVLIKHAGDKTTTYAHLSRSTVDKYDRVKQGDIIGYVGSTGNMKDPQLHFAVQDGKTPVDPKKFLPTNMASN